MDKTARVKMNGIRDWMWSQIGVYHGACMYRFFGTRKMRYSMIAAGDINGFVVEACSVMMRERGGNDSDLCCGTIGKERFKLWVKKEINTCIRFL